MQSIKTQPVKFFKNLTNVKQNTHYIRTHPTPYKNHKAITIVKDNLESETVPKY